MSDHEQPTTVYEDPDMGLSEDDDAAGLADALPARPRRKLLTPVSGGLLAVLLVAGGFIGGVQVQKHQGDDAGAGNGLPAGLAARLAQGGGAPGAAGGAATGTSRAGGGSGGATAGTVANVKSSTLYVTSADGTTVKVKTNDSSKVTRNATSSVGSVHPGDTVVIQGSTASTGTVTAASVTATAKGVTPGGFGGAFPGGGAAGTAPKSGESASPVPEGFAPPSG